MGAYSGETHPPSHLSGTYGGISHPRYNDIVKDELVKYMKSNNIKVMDQDKKTWDFIKKVEDGLNHQGKPHKELKAFNDAIRKQRSAYLKGEPGTGFPKSEQWTVARRKGSPNRRGHASPSVRSWPHS